MFSLISCLILLTVMAGRPLELDFELAHSDAILYSFHPGTMGGPALAQLIFGDETPSGKTPVTFPKSTGQTSLGNTSYWLDAGFGPQFPFGVQ